MLNLVSEWKLDEGSGITTADSWSGGNTGTLIGATHLPTWKTDSDCINNSCIQFDGIDDYVRVLDNDNLDFGTGPFTLSLWAKSNEFKSTANIILKKATYIFNTTPGWGIQYANSPQKLYVGIANGTSSIQYNTGLDSFGWTFLGITRRDNNEVYFIKNGTLVLLGTMPGDISNASNLQIGGGSSSFSGLIDDIRIFNASMSMSEIKKQYYSGLNSMLANGTITREEYSLKLMETALR